MLAYATANEDFRVWGFLNLVVEVADDISNAVAPRTALIDDTGWLRSQIDDAFGEFNMMQLGGEDRHCVQSARLLLQLSRDFAWATSHEGAA
jgi:hypothetical protein